MPKKLAASTIRSAKPEPLAKPSAKAPSAMVKKAKPAAANADAGLVGKKAPAFTLPDQDGKVVSLASLTARGPVVLYFYPKDMTPGCTVEACSFRDNSSKLRAIGAQVVGVSADSPASHVKFIAKQSLNFPLLSDPDNAVTKAYGVYKMKSLYGRQFMGIVRTTYLIGPDGKVARRWDNVKVDKHAEDVLEAVQNL